MGVVDINFGGNSDREDRILKKPEKYREKAGIWMRKRPKISLVSGTIFILLLLYGIVPLGFLYFLPGWIVDQVVYALTAGTFGYYAGRHLWKRHGSVPTEIVYQLNLGATPMIRRFRTLEGRFRELFDFEHGSPVQEKNANGETTYTVVNLDFNEQIAYCSPWGDMPQAKMFEKKEAIRSQFLYNDRLRKLGAEINMKLEQIVSQVEHDYANAFIRKLETAAHPEDMLDESKEALPDSNVDIETPTIEDIAEKTDIENLRDIEPENQIDSGN